MNSVLQAANALLSRATRFETPCGAGAAVWHRWLPEQSDPSLAPLVLLHGGSGSWNHWLSNIPALLQSGRQLWLPDLPGFGDSASPPSGNDADVLPAPLEAGLRQLLGSQACDLVGFSFGGMTAALLAAEFPARVARLVLVGAPGLGIEPAAPFHLKPWRQLPEGPARDAVHRANLAELMLYRPEAISELALRLHAINLVRDRMPIRRLSRGDIVARTLPQLHCPLHAIYGSEDVLYRGKLDELEAVLRSAGDFRSLTLIENAGHWVQFERSEPFDAALLAALQAPL